MKHGVTRQVLIYLLQSMLCITCMLFAKDDVKTLHDIQQKEDPIITVIGTGYVGLVGGAGLAEFGNQVICADVDSRKIEMLRAGGIPIYEPGLKELVDRNVEAGRLVFTDDVAAAIAQADFLFIAVGTPMSEEGNADMKYVYSVVDTIAKNINGHKIIITKSTVPVGTGKAIRETLENKYGIDGSLFSMVSNPEFLREGTAVGDFLYPDRVVIGAENDMALEAMCNIYQCLIDKNVPHVLTNIQTAESIKYAANAFLATKLSFINELANLCDVVGADVKVLAHAIGLDSRIGEKFLFPGPGYGGSCFPKDTQALVYIASLYGIALNTVQSAIAANQYQKTIAIKKLKKLFNQKFGSDNLMGKNIAVLGLAFKAETDDIRYSPSIELIQDLITEGAIVHTYDPAAMENMKMFFPNINYCASTAETIHNADAVVIMTEWDEFKYLDIADAAQKVEHKILLDMRNILDPIELKSYGFICDAIGMSYLCKEDLASKGLFIPKKMFIS